MFFTNKIPLFPVYFVHKVKYFSYIRLFFVQNIFLLFPRILQQLFFCKICLKYICILPFSLLCRWYSLEYNGSDPIKHILIGSVIMYQIDFNKPINIHFIGIGGISMSGLAEILLDRGFRISGSDAKKVIWQSIWSKRVLS